MKTQFIEQLKPGDTVNDVFVLSEKNISQKKNGDDYLNVTLADKTGKVKGVVWDNVETISMASSTGDIVKVKATVSEYNGMPQFVVKNMKTVPKDQADPADFIAATTRNVDAMFDRLVTLTKSMENGCIRSLMDAFWDDPVFVKQFKTAPAAKGMHHNYIGGLLEHTLSMAILVERIGGHYSGVDMDLLLAGAILHDIGKIREYRYDYTIDTSDEGRMLSHIVIGVGMVEEKIAGIPDFPEETAMLIKHLIVSHHGVKEFGSPEVPKTIEAVILNFIDEIDAKVNGIRQFMASQDPSENWTPFHRLLGRQFYRGKQEG